MNPPGSAYTIFVLVFLGFVLAFVIANLRSAQAAGRGSQQRSNSADLAAGGESVARELLKSAQAAGRGLHRRSNSADSAAPRESVVRELFTRRRSS